jgi:diaminopimelate decarboxylase
MLTTELLHSLAQNYGTPLYIIDEEELSRCIEYINTCFSKIPTTLIVAYPYKANPLPGLIQYMHRHSRWAEVASGLEIELAINSGIDPEKIIFNAPYKSNRDLVKAMSLGCKIHIDNFEEIVRIENIIRAKITTSVDVGIRVSYPGLDNWSRFGFELGSDVFNAIREIMSIKQLRLVGLHGHRSNITDLGEYRFFLKTMFSLYKSIEQTFGKDLKYIDVGSGFAIDFPKPIASIDWQIPDIRDYAKVLSEIWVENEPFGSRPYVIIEPGRSSVASSGILLTRVISIKRRGNDNIAFTDIALNFLPGAEIYKYNIKKISLRDNKKSEKIMYKICGCLCDSLDIIDSNFVGPELLEDDLLCIPDVGGYDMARSFVWQLPLPKIIWIGSEKTIRVIDR